jgi:putative hydrolase of the HAD superfamily
MTHQLTDNHRPLDVAVFDLDETLYPRHCGIMRAIGERITLYVEQFFGMPTAEARALRHDYFVRYGTTLRGLQVNHLIDADEYMAFVHDVPVEASVGYDARLDEALASIAARKVVFTNASWEHAERVLAARQLRHHFERIIDVRDMGWISKPAPDAYARLLALLGSPASRTMLVEDNVRNLRPAAELGMITVLVDGDGEGVADFVIDEIWEIGNVYATLNGAGGNWQGGILSHQREVG